MHVSRLCLRDEILQRGSTEVSVKITGDEEENRWFEIGAYYICGNNVDLRDQEHNKGEERSRVEWSGVEWRGGWWSGTE